MKGILFNQDMVKAILGGRKTATQRVVKPQPIERPSLKMCQDDVWKLEWWNVNEFHSIKVPICIGDILYVRETWTVLDGNYEYKADVDDGYGPFCSSCTLDICTGSCNSILKWHPSIHMPREAARVFLRVTDVRVKRLQDITEEQAKMEGAQEVPWAFDVDDVDGKIKSGPMQTAIQNFAGIWDSTIKPANRALYGWDANPWVWVIEFEHISKEEALA